jgi:hypothetical protein
MPSEEDKILKFTALDKTQRHPFSIYLDFESSLVPITESEKTQTQLKQDKIRKLFHDDPENAGKENEGHGGYLASRLPHSSPAHGHAQP